MKGPRCGVSQARYGITADYSPMRHMASFEPVYTYDDTDIHTLVPGEDLTGVAAFE